MLARTDMTIAAPGGKIVAVRSLDLWVMNADGSNLERLDTQNAGLDTDPAWAPGGAQIAFRSQRGSAMDLWRISSNGSGLTQITSNRVSEREPTWSPNGQQLAFVSSDSSCSSGIYVLNVDGSLFPDGSSQKLIKCGGSAPHWSRTNRITYLSGYNIHVMNSDGSGARQITDDYITTPPRWSPDGSKIVYMTLFDLKVIDASGANDRIIYTDYTSKKDPVWSPDGNHIAYAGPDGIYVLEVGTQKPQKIASGTYQRLDWGVDGAGSTPSPTPSPTSTPSPTPSPTSTPSPTPSPTANIVADALEVTQGIQDLNNSVVLIAGRPTYVRAYVKSKPGRGDQTRVTAMLYAQRGGVDLPISPLSPINAGGTITVTEHPDRGQLNDSFLFELPSNWLNGTVEFELRGATEQIECEGKLTDCKMTVTFEPSPEIKMRFVRIVWQDASGAVHSPDFSDIIDAANQIMDLYPVPNVNVVWSGSHSKTKVLPQPKTATDFVGLQLLVQDFRVLDGCIFCDRFDAGILVDPPPAGSHAILGQSTYPGFPGSQLFGGPSNAVVAYVGTDWTRTTLAHELGHANKRDHVQCTGTEKLPIDEGFPGHPTGRISTALWGPEVFYGFHIRTFETLLPKTCDFMSYARKTWTSKYTYEAIRDNLVKRYGTSIATPTLSAADQAIIVSGVITPTQGMATLEPLYTLDDPGVLPAPAPGSYTLRFEDAAGAVLASFPFEPDTPVELATTVSDEPELRSFVLALPWSAGAARVVLLHGDQVLATQSASASPPTVAVISPNGGESLSSGPVTLSWSASDPDGDPLVYVVQYSRDNGATWQTIAVDLDATTLEIDPADLPGGDQSLLRVQASDGFHTAVDQSDAVFSVAHHAPEAFIDGLANGGLYVGEQMLLLDGSAYDLEDGTLPGTALRWRSNRDGALGSGEELAVKVSGLSTGTHTITLTATDSDGQTATASVTIQVYRERPNLPAGLSVAPWSMSFVTPFGTTATLTETVTIRNSGDGDLNWTTSADQPWLSLSATAGTAPDNLTLTVDPRNLASGDHSGTITFSATGVEPQTVNVNLYVQEAAKNPTIYLPLVTR
jgi:Tol biopolymer transport system component